MREGTGQAPARVEPGAVTTMSASGQFRDDDKSLWFLAGTLALSMTAHVVTMVYLPEVMARKVERNVEMEFYEPPPPPPPPKVEEPPKVEPPKPIVKPIQIKVAAVIPPKDVPPPPNQDPPPEPQRSEERRVGKECA